MNHYQTLGIDRTADAKDIKRAYAKLIKEYRPDSHPVEFDRIRIAYEYVLKDIERRNQAQRIDVIENFESEKPAQSQRTPVPPEGAADNKSAAFEAEGCNSLEKNPHPVTILLRKLDELSYRQDELAGKALAIELLGQLHSVTLDEQFEIESALLSWIFNNEKPLLLAFIEIDARFNWTKNLAYFERPFTFWEGDRLQNLRKLAELYAHAVLQNSSSLATHQKDTWSFFMSAAQRSQRKQWQRLCRSLGYVQLEKYFKPPPQYKFPIIWVDVVIAFVVGLIGWNSTSDADDLTPYFVSAWLFTVALVVKVFLGAYISRRLINLKLSRRLFSVLFFMLGLWGMAGWVNNHYESRKFVIVHESHACNGTSYTVPPVYPRESRIRGEEGDVRISVLVGTDGSVISSSVEKSSGFEQLDQVSLTTIKNWCFVPIQKSGKPVQAHVIVPLKFRLES